MLPSVAIVGRPNVGKSTLFNRIVGQRQAITDETPGVTRDRLYARAEWLTRTFNLIDTGGIDFEDAPFIHDIKAQTEIAIEESDVVLFLVDAETGVTDHDADIARLLYRTDTPVVLAVNKVDDVTRKGELYEFYALGLGEPFPVSATHGVGVGDLLERVIEYLPERAPSPYPEDTIKLCLIGRPNVGKSSLMNALLGEERVIVSEIAGTTRDAVDSIFEKNGQEYVIIDTAGLRKRGKVYERAEKYSVLRALNAIDRSDIALFLVDAEQGIIEQDKKVAGYAYEAGKATVIIVNKWDTVERDHSTMNEWERNIRHQFRFLPDPPVIFLSALTKERLDTLYPVLLDMHERYRKRVQTSVLNDVLLDAFASNPPKSYNGGVLKGYYATQVETAPPKFVLFVNDPAYLHFTYERYLKNQLRRAFGFEGIPINLVLRKRD